jgi:hypothetical protein
MHEIHRPAFIDRGRLIQGLRFLPNQGLSGLDTQIRLQFPVDSVYPFMVPFEPPITQIQKTDTETPIALALSQANQPVGWMALLDEAATRQAKTFIVDNGL